MSQPFILDSNLCEREITDHEDIVIEYGQEKVTLDNTDIESVLKRGSS